MKPTALLITTVLATALSGCKDEVTPPPESPRPVIVQTVAEPAGDERRTFTGVISVAGAATLGFEVGGRIISIPAKEGRAYKKGEVLAQLDVSNYQADLQRAEAEAQQMNQELKRTQQLFESDNASRSQFDQAVAAQKSAAAAVTVARKKVADGTLRMPHDGVIEDVFLDEQSVVSAGTKVLSIQGKGVMKVNIGVPAEVVSRVTVGMTSQVRVGTVDQSLAAQVDRVYPQASKNGTYPVSLVLENPGSEIRGGMDAEADLTFASPNGQAVTVESSAVLGTAGAENFVWLIEPGSDGETGVTRKRTVRVGALRAGGEIAVLEGLKPRELVVTRGVNYLKENQTVKIRHRN